MFLLILYTTLISTALYIYLIKKTRIAVKYLYIDNLLVILLSLFFSYLMKDLFNVFNLLIYLVSLFSVLGFAFIITMLRFWRTPKRKVIAKDNELVSPADGNIIYIKEFHSNEIPVAVKQGIEAKLNELTKTDLIDYPCWLIGINMTPFDVHKNCAPVEGEVILNQHFQGSFLSLKMPDALIRNERNTLIIDQGSYKVGVVQTASRLVRRIDSYVEKGSFLRKGQWFGMIRFGSQVDVIIPKDFNLCIEVGQQVYAAKTIFARK